jgi:hypothetical protein
MPKLFEIDPSIMQVVYGERFNGDPRYDPIAHLKKFERICDTIKINNVSNERIKVKIFPYSLDVRSLDWFLNWPLGTFHSLYNIKLLLWRDLDYLPS